MTPEGPVNPNSNAGGRPRRRKRYAGRYPRRPDQRYKEMAPERFPEIHAHVRAQGRTPVGSHVPVLLAEVLEVLRPQPGETVVDGTVGYGGHAMELLKRIGPTGRLLGFDIDATTLGRTRERLAAVFPEPDADLPVVSPEPDADLSAEALAKAEASGRPRQPAASSRVILRRGNFAGIDRALAEEDLDGCDIILADLGVSSMQIDDPSRGFSYKHDGPLDMRMDSRLKRTAEDILRTMPEAELAAALEKLADEPDAAEIARRVVESRTRKLITRTRELVQLIFAVKGLSRRAWREQAAAENPRGGSPYPPRESADLHPAARTFQALRILVNDELSALRALLRVAPSCLRPGGRIAVIAFHSGEDRLVRLAFQDGLRAGVYSSASDEPVRPGSDEQNSNPRSASARLRWAVKA